MRDATAGLRQEMFFLGRDVAHPSGNLLVRAGFERRPSNGLQGTSCYRLPWQGGRIELHGACAGWYPDDGGTGFVYIRALGRCLPWIDRNPPVPGEWASGMGRSTNPTALRETGLPFFSWWLFWEQQILQSGGGDYYRASCYRTFRKLPKSRVWLPPEAAIAWLGCFLSDPAGLARSNRFLGGKMCDYVFETAPLEGGHQPARFEITNR